MKILFITHYAEMLGANRSLMALIKDLIEQYGIHATLLCPEDGDITKEAEKIGVRTINIGGNYTWTAAKNARFSFGNNVLRKIRHYIVTEIGWKKVRKEKFDLIHCNSSVTDLGYVLSHKMNIPLVWHLREFGTLDYGQFCFFSKEYQKKAFESASTLIAISQAISEYYRKIAPSAKIETVYNGVKAFERSCSNNPDKIIKFCVVGLLCDAKNQMEVLKAINALKQQGVSGFEVDFVGDGTEEYQNNLKKYISKYGIEKYVKFWGYRTDVNNILNEMNVGIVSSRNEAFGRVTVEFMLAEMPIIGTNTGGTVELIKNGVNGHLYESGNFNELANWMNYYINDHAQIKNEGQNGKKCANERFTLKANTDKVWDIFCKTTM